MPDKVYSVSPSTNTFPADYARRVEALKADIERLAEEDPYEVVYFHTRLEPVLASTAVYLECSNDFLNKVRKLPDFSLAIEVLPGGRLKTVREHSPVPLKQKRQEDAAKQAREADERAEIAQALKKPAIKFKFKK